MSTRSPRPRRRAYRTSDPGLIERRLVAAVSTHRPNLGRADRIEGLRLPDEELNWERVAWATAHG